MNAITRLRHDIQQLHKAERVRDQEAKELRGDKREVKADKRELKRDRDEFVSDRKTLGDERATLRALRDTLSFQLSPLEAQRQALQAAFDATGNVGLLPQLTALDQSIADVRAALDLQIASQQAVVDAKCAEVETDRAEIKSDRREIAKDRFEIKRDTRALERARDHVKRDHHRALEHLRPAEYGMGLKQTNRYRKMLGLKPVDHVIRPGEMVTGYVNGVARQIRVMPVGNGESLRVDAAESWKKMVEAARRDGVYLSPGSGFRTMDEQRYLYDLYLSGRGNRAAVPGYSNHQGGVAIDIDGVGGYGTRTFNWLAAHAGHFGFRNTVSGEYWHWSYKCNG